MSIGLKCKKARQRGSHQRISLPSFVASNLPRKLTLDCTAAATIRSQLALARVSHANGFIVRRSRAHANVGVTSPLNDRSPRDEKSAGGREEPIAALAMSADCKDFRHSAPLAQCIEAPRGLGVSESTEVLQRGRAVLRCQCQEDPLMAVRVNCGWRPRAVIGGRWRDPRTIRPPTPAPDAVTRGLFIRVSPPETKNATAGVA